MFLFELFSFHLFCYAHSVLEPLRKRVQGKLAETGTDVLDLMIFTQCISLIRSLVKMDFGLICLNKQSL